MHNKINETENNNYSNSLRRGFLIPGILFLSIFSGITVPLGSREYLALASIISAAYTFTFILLKFRSFRVNKGLAMIILIFILFANGSPLTTIMLVVFNIGMFLILSKHIFRPFDARDQNLVFWIWLFFVFISIASLIIFPQSVLWSYYPPTVDAVTPFRLKMMFAEPSHLGLFALFLMSISTSWRLKFLLFLSILLTQSFFAAVAFIIIMFRGYIKSLYLVALASFITFIYFAYLSPDLFWLNSGAIRLIGAGYLFQDVDLMGLFFGHGLGAGDIKLTEVFESNGVDQANGFLFSSIYDVGLIGMIMLFYLMCRNKFELFVLNILLLNFGLGSFILIIIFLLSKKMGLEAGLKSNNKLNRASV